MNDIQFNNHEILDQFHNDFVTEFGHLDKHEDATNGDGLPYWKEWKGNKYFNNAEGDFYVCAN